LHAGILRLALATQRAGITSGAALELESLPQGLLLHIRGVEETPDNAASFAKAKRLLEHSLGKTILLHLHPDVERNPSSAEPLQTVPTIAIVRTEAQS